MSRMIVISTSMIWHHVFQESHSSKVFNFKDNWGTYFIFRHCLTAGTKYKTQMGLKSQQGSWKTTLPDFLGGDVSLVSSSAPDPVVLYSTTADLACKTLKYDPALGR